MIPIRMTIIGIPRNVWDSLPRDRSLNAVSLDAEGSARRIAKGVNVRIETTRFRQLCSYIEATAIDLLSALRGQIPEDRRFAGVSLSEMRVLELDDLTGQCDASEYLDVLDAVASRMTKVEMPDVLCRSIFRPGEQVQCHAAALRSIVGREGSMYKLGLSSQQLDGACSALSVQAFFESLVTTDHGVVQCVTVHPH